MATHFCLLSPSGAPEGDRGQGRESHIVPASVLRNISHSGCISVALALWGAASAMAWVSMSSLPQRLGHGHLLPSFSCLAVVVFSVVATLWVASTSPVGLCNSPRPFATRCPYELLLLHCLA